MNALSSSFILTKQPKPSIFIRRSATSGILLAYNSSVSLIHAAFLPRAPSGGAFFFGRNRSRNNISDNNISSDISTNDRINDSSSNSSSGVSSVIGC